MNANSCSDHRFDGTLSVVVPVKDEEENIGSLLEEIKLKTGGSVSALEIIVVNDGSQDRTRGIIASSGIHPLRYVEFDRNYGQTAALDCGFKMASGDIVAALDGDGQNDPGDIPSMISYMIGNGLDVVCGWRKDRKDNYYRRFLMRLAYYFRQLFLHDGILDSGCTLKVFTMKALAGLDLSDGQHRFIPAIMRLRGMRIGEIEVSHRPRNGGKSKYHSMGRVLHGIKDAFALRRSKGKVAPVLYSIKEIIHPHFPNIFFL